MNLLADESVSFPIVEKLRQAGFEVVSILEDFSEITDADVIQKAIEINALLITEDKDFGELTYRLGHLSHGVLLIRLSGFSNEDKSDMVFYVIEEYLDELFNKFSVLSDKGLRIRSIK